MAITIEERDHQGAAVLAVTGRMTTSECRGALKNVIGSLIERGRKQIVIDLEAVPFLDSAGLTDVLQLPDLPAHLVPRA